MTVKLRVADVLRILLDGAEAWDIRAYVSGKCDEGNAPWKLDPGQKPLSERQIERYTAEARVEIDASLATTKKQRRRTHLAQRRSLFARAVNSGDVRSALAVLQDLARLENLYPAVKVRAKVDGSVTGEMKLVYENDWNAPGEGTDVPPAAPAAAPAAPAP